MPSTTTFCGRDMSLIYCMTKELPQEVNAQIKCQQAQAMRGARANKSTSNSVKVKQFNTSTYKIHCILDYPDMIRKYGTTDSFSTQTVGFIHPAIEPIVLTVTERACKGFHSLMPDLGRVVEGDGQMGLRSGFHQRYERTRWGKRIGSRWNEPCSN